MAVSPCIRLIGLTKVSNHEDAVIAPEIATSVINNFLALMLEEKRNVTLGPESASNKGVILGIINANIRPIKPVVIICENESGFTNASICEDAAIAPEMAINVINNLNGFNFRAPGELTASNIGSRLLAITENIAPIIMALID